MMNFELLRKDFLKVLCIVKGLYIVYLTLSCQISQKVCSVYIIITPPF